MYPPPFDYYRPETLSQATELLGEHGNEAVALAGGMSLLPRLKAREIRPAYVVDIGRLSELATSTRADRSIYIGALSSHADVARSDLVRDHVPVLSEAASKLGDPQVRNAGTIGGSVAEIYPGADLAACLVALDARLHCVGPLGNRVVDVREQFATSGLLATETAELIEKVEVPIPQSLSGGAHLRLERRQGLAVMGCSAAVTLDSNGRYQSVSCALNGLAPQPVCALSNPPQLVGTTPQSDIHRDAAADALASVESFTDIRGSSAYRIEVAKSLLAQALDRAAERAQAKAGGS
jgi:aerobic carbon-monoxide dehydrogenase medium subunit